MEQGLTVRSWLSTCVYRANMLYSHCTIARYRLAPQFPFPCGLQDCLAAYLYLLTVQDPSTIVLAGDSAGGGMVLRLDFNPNSMRWS